MVTNLLIGYESTNYFNPHILAYVEFLLIFNMYLYSPDIKSVDP